MPGLRWKQNQLTSAKQYIGKPQKYCELSLGMSQFIKKMGFSKPTLPIESLFATSFPCMGVRVSTGEVQRLEIKGKTILEQLVFCLL